MVPVIATILDNYIRVVDRIRASSSAAASTDPEASRSKQHKSVINGPLATSTSTSTRRELPPRTSRASFYDHRSDQRNARRQAPPPSIEIPLPYSQDGPENNTATTAATTATTAATEGRHNNLHTPIDVQPSPHIVLTSPPERTTFNHHHHHHHHQREGHRHRIMQPLASAAVTTTTTPTTITPTTDPFNPLRQARDVDRLPSALPGLQAGITSQPESPTTPLGAGAPQANIPPLMPRIFHRRPSVRQQRSTSGESEDADAQPDDNDIIMGEGDLDTANVDATERQPIVDLDSSAMDLEDINMRDRDAMLDDASTVNAPTRTAQATASPVNGHPQTHTHARQPNGHQAPGVFNNPYPFYLQNQNQTQHHQPFQSQSNPQANPQSQSHSQSQPQPHSSRSGNLAGPTILAAMPRDEDVLLALQLLAYVSKYCNLRSYFQQTHLVPRLKIGKELEVLDEANPLPASTSSSTSAPASTSITTPQAAEEAQEEMEEYILPDDFNIFPLVEKFTVRHHTKDMQYWACVVMRNLCRKDDSRGGIRQCAYYKCGKWEEFQRQFAKCRRCRRTKYCSKECQKSAWVYHRHWCHSSPEH